MAETHDHKPKTFVLGENALIPIGIAVAVLLAAIGGTWGVSSFISGLKSDNALLRTEIGSLTKEVGGLRDDLIQRNIDTRNEFAARILALESRIAEAGSDRFRGRDFDVWVRQFNAENKDKGVIAPARDKE